MKVLLVNGSPNKKGCTNAALEEIIFAWNLSDDMGAWIICVTSQPDFSINRQ